MPQGAATSSTPKPCPQCGYDLSDHHRRVAGAAFACPECGHELTRKTLDFYLREQRMTLRIPWWWWILSFAPAEVTWLGMLWAAATSSNSGSLGTAIAVAAFGLTFGGLPVLCVFAASRQETVFSRAVVAFMIWVTLLIFNIMLAVGGTSLLGRFLFF